MSRLYDCRAAGEVKPALLAHALCAPLAPEILSPVLPGPLDLPIHSQPGLDKK